MYIVEDLITGVIVKMCQTEKEAQEYIKTHKDRVLFYTYTVDY